MNLKTPLDPLPAELLLRLIDRLPLIIWVATADLTRIIYVNPVCAQIYGCSPADLYARPSLYVDAIHPEDRQEVVDFFTAHHGREAVREYRLMRPDGSVRWVRDHTLPATQDYWCGFVEDITEPRQVATELGDQKKFLQSLLTAISDPVVILNSDLTIILHNAALQTWFPSQVLRGRKCYQIFHLSDSPCDQCPSLLSLQTQSPTYKLACMAIAEPRSGQTKQVEVFAFPFLMEGIQSIRGVIQYWRDVTERETAREAMVDSEAKYQALVEQIPAIIYTASLDAVSTTLFVSPQVEEILGYSPEEYHRDPNLYKNILHPDDRERVLAELAHCHATGEKFISEYRMLAKDGRTVWFRDEAQIVYNLQGEPLFLQGVMLDLSVRKRQELELLASQQQIKSLATEMTLTEARERQRLAMDLHDNIGQILALAQIQLGELQQTSPASFSQEKVKEIRNLVNRAIQCTRSLTFELGLPILYELELEEAVGWQAEQFQKQHGLKIRLTKSGRSQPTSEVNKVLIFRIVRELLINIIKHAQARNVHISFRWAGQNLTIEVIDDGAGFVMADVEADIAKTEAFGILAIRERLSYLSGSFAWHSSPGCGTTVTVSVPLNNLCPPY